MAGQAKNHSLRAGQTWKESVTKRRVRATLVDEIAKVVEYHFLEKPHLIRSATLKAFRLRYTPEAV